MLVSKTLAESWSFGLTFHPDIQICPCNASFRIALAVMHLFVRAYRIVHDIQIYIEYVRVALTCTIHNRGLRIYKRGARVRASVTTLPSSISVTPGLPWTVAAAHASLNIIPHPTGTT